MGVGNDPRQGHIERPAREGKLIQRAS